MALYVHVLSFWLVVEVLIILILVRSCKNDKMEGFSEPQMEGYVNSFNYPIEVYNVETSDGYILKLFRIPHGKYNKSESKGPPIILMHAFMASSESYVMLGENQSLAFLAAEAGYDVWMPNARGNTHSRKHKTLNPDKDFSFWNFSYIGHSQGGTVLFVMTSEKPEYKEKINVVIGLAPAVYLNNFDHPYLMDFVDNFEAIYEGHSMVKSGERIFYSNYSDIRYLLFAFKGLLPSLIIKYWTLFTGESEVSNWVVIKHYS
ncbi:unnamed protein product [Brassicogethes aeneus]|uniref:Partial AB-hydrolase lipase domain-containing protein n=1 Tax=Brassicogethes aeneus TaxID=1431903 RepID=A0A9P0B1P9_BRAAE|nr:unnamed protein product [Brassicogethes aeneus]